MNKSQLLKAYLAIWNNRSINFDTNEEDGDQLTNLMKKELLDQLTHPRVRVSAEIKFYKAVKRIVNTELSQLEKLELIQEFVQVLEELKKPEEN
jgi:hypothetical protein